MAAKFFSTALLLASTVSAAALAPRQDNAIRFKLRSVPSGPGDQKGPDVGGMEVGYMSPADGVGIVTLVPEGEGRMVKGSEMGQVSFDDFKCGGGGDAQWALKSGGSATVPAANTVDLLCNNDGNDQFFMGAEEERMVLKNHDGFFAACDGPIVGTGKEVIALTFLSNGQRPLEGCRTVSLLPVYD